MSWDNLRREQLLHVRATDEKVLERAMAQAQVILDTSGNHPIGVAKLIRDVWAAAVEELDY